jgi:NRPS condensation-like uncharacterized protein
MKRELGTFERAQVFTNEHYPFNAVVVIRLRNGPGENTVRKALNLLQKRHMLLRTHVIKEKKRYYFVSENTKDLPLTIIKRKNNEQWQQVAENELDQRIDIFKDPPMRMIYITDIGSHTKSEIVATFQHVAMDASSGAELLNQFLTFCERIESHQDYNGFYELSTLPAAEIFFPKAYQGLRGTINNFRFFMRQIWAELLYRIGTKNIKKAPIHESGRCKILTMTLPKDTTSALYKQCRKKRITINNLFNAAIMIAVQKHLYQSKSMPIKNFNFANLRPYLEPPLGSEYLGSYFSMVSFTAKIKENPDTWETARRINEITYKSLKSGDKFSNHLLSPVMMKALIKSKSFRMAHAAMSFTGPLLLSNLYGEIEVLDVHAFVSNFTLGPEYTAQVRLFAKEIIWDILYLDSDMDRQLAQVIADEIRTILENSIKEES